jgi:hypothetical protein
VINVKTKKGKNNMSITMDLTKMGSEDVKRLGVIKWGGSKC